MKRAAAKSEFTRFKRDHPDLVELVLSHYPKVHDRYVAVYMFCMAMPPPKCEICGVHLGVTWKMPRKCGAHINTTEELRYTYDRLSAEVPGVYEQWEGKVSRNTTIQVHCPVHGWYSQMLSSRLSGHGCQKCYFELKKGMYRIDARTYLDTFKERHGDRYDYSRVTFGGAETKIEIGCPDHGSFWQVANVHKAGHGCPRCAIEASIPRLVNAAAKNLRPGKTTDTRPELEFKSYLDARGIQYIHQYAIHHTDDRGRTARNVVYDFYLPSKNMIVDIDGEYWHTSHIQARRDKFKTMLALSNGYLILRISDQDMCFDMIDAPIDDIKQHNTRLIDSRKGKLR